MNSRKVSLHTVCRTWPGAAAAFAPRTVGWLGAAAAWAQPLHAAIGVNANALWPAGRSGENVEVVRQHDFAVVNGAHLIQRIALRHSVVQPMVENQQARLCRGGESSQIGGRGMR